LDLPKPEKIEAVAELKERLQSHVVAIATQYKGVTVEQVTELRRKLRAEGVEFKVYKNTLVLRALDELGIAGGAGIVEGPTAWAFSKDPVTPAKIIRDFAKEVKVVAINGGILEGRAITKAQAESLATLPAKEVLLAQAIGTMAAPLRNFLGVLQGVPRNFASVLDQIRKQKEEAAAA
jgi:large subunit ribosomal protein L10